jgi:hypothetical protein
MIPSPEKLAFIINMQKTFIPVHLRKVIFFNES